MPDKDPSVLVAELSDTLAALVAAADRGTGLALLNELLPWELRNLDGHPHPVQLVALVEHELRTALSGAPLGERLDVLRSRVAQAKAWAADGEALRLALMRYALDNPTSAATVKQRLAPALPVQSRRELADRIAAARAALASIDSPDAAHLVERARQNLAAAEGGGFDLVDASLAAELRSLGAEPSEFDAH